MAAELGRLQWVWRVCNLAREARVENLRVRRIIHQRGKRNALGKQQGQSRKGPDCISTASIGAIFSVVIWLIARSVLEVIHFKASNSFAVPVKNLSTEQSENENVETVLFWSNFIPHSKLPS